MDSFAFRQRPLRERFAGAAGALLLQGGFLVLFLYSMPQFSRPIEVARELTFILHRPPPPVPAPVLPTPGVITALPAPAPQVQTPNALATPPAALPDLRNFGQALNDCAPERYASLPPERQARCPKPGAGAPMGDTATNILAKDEAHWQTEFAHEQSPLWLPCTFADGRIAGINFYCLGVMAAKGTLTDKDNWPVYGGN
jgi:hypothetical protein